MKRKTWIITGAAVLAFGGVLSLFEDKPDKAEAEPKPTASAPAKPDEKPSKEVPKPSGIPSPDTAQTAKLIDALRAIDPALVTKEDRAVSRARNICSDIQAHEDTGAVRSKAKARYEGGAVTLTDGQAADIVAAVKESFCG
ncbi:hypothetical protein [Streptomyces celluloflavus]|uniref:hypothetical protein n=1 Tax=Streptomyces celluloflavus TaxID=58344 RepID=UPI00369E36E4